jgi:hypothetical protein
MAKDQEQGYTEDQQPQDDSSSKEARLQQLQKQIDELIAEREKLKGGSGS